METKKKIQDEFYIKLGLKVDVVKRGSGTSSNGNTSRRFFYNPDLTSEIIGVNKELIQRFGVTLEAMLNNLGCTRSIPVPQFDTSSTPVPQATNSAHTRT